MVRIKRYSVASKVLIAFFAFTGIILQTGITEGTFRVVMFRMFTNLSNLMCGIYFLIAALVIAADKKRDGGNSPLPLFKGVCTMSITLTGVVASAVVASEYDAHTAYGIATVLLHIVTPVLILCDWLIFDTKGRWKRTAPLWWLTVPYAYFVFIMVTANIMEKDSKMRFPYPFLNYEQTGIPFLVMAVAIMTVFYVGIGYLCIGIDEKMGRLESVKPPIAQEQSIKKAKKKNKLKETLEKEEVM